MFAVAPVAIVIGLSAVGRRAQVAAFGTGEGRAGSGLPESSFGIDRQARRAPAREGRDRRHVQSKKAKVGVSADLTFC